MRTRGAAWTLTAKLTKDMPAARRRDPTRDPHRVEVLKTIQQLWPTRGGIIPTEASSPLDQVEWLQSLGLDLDEGPVDLVLLLSALEPPDAGRGVDVAKGV